MCQLQIGVGLRLLDVCQLVSSAVLMFEADGEVPLTLTNGGQLILPPCSVLYVPLSTLGHLFHSESARTVERSVLPSLTAQTVLTGMVTELTKLREL
jgi:hypothetical protein